MTPSRPYLLRALNEWIVDNNLTPHIVVNAQIEGVIVPTEYVRDGQIILNINPSAVRDLLVSNEAIEFNARFSGRPMTVYLPIKAVLAIYAKENGQGMVFGAEAGVEATSAENVAPAPTASAQDSKVKPEKPAGKPNLTVIK